MIGGRDSRIIPTDLTFGSTTVRYSTAEVLLSAALDEEREILILYGTPGRNETFEVVFAGLGSAQVQGGERGSTNATTWDVVRRLDVTAFCLQGSSADSASPSPSGRRPRHDFPDPLGSNIRFTFGRVDDRAHP